MRRYVFVTSAEPYSSTNWRFAPSRVLGFRSAVVALMSPRSVKPRRNQQPPRNPQAAADQPQADGDADRQEVGMPKAGHVDLDRFAEMLRNWLLEPMWHGSSLLSSHADQTRDGTH